MESLIKKSDYNTIIAKVQEFAGLLMLPKEIAQIIEVEPSDFIEQLKTTKSDFYRAFYAGFLQTEIKIREKMYSENAAFDIEEAQYKMQQLNDFKTKLEIQLNA